MTQHSDLLEHERRKLLWLRAKLTEQEHRVKVLESLQDDPLDALIERDTNAERPTAGMHLPPVMQALPSAVSEVPASKVLAGWKTPAAVWGAAPKLPRRVPPTWVAILRFLGREGKTYEEVKAFIQRSNIELSEGAARTQLMAYRRDYEFVDNPRKGFYIATERALKFIDDQEGTAPAGQGGAVKTQPDPRPGDAA